MGQEGSQGVRPDVRRAGFGHGVKPRWPGQAQLGGVEGLGV